MKSVVDLLADYGRKHIYKEDGEPRDRFNASPHSLIETEGFLEEFISKNKELIKEFVKDEKNAFLFFVCIMEINIGNYIVHINFRSPLNFSKNYNLIKDIAKELKGDLWADFTDYIMQDMSDAEGYMGRFNAGVEYKCVFRPRKDDYVGNEDMIHSLDDINESIIDTIYHNCKDILERSKEGVDKIDPKKKHIIEAAKMEIERMLKGI